MQIAMKYRHESRLQGSRNKKKEEIRNEQKQGEEK